MTTYETSQEWESQEWELGETELVGESFEAEGEQFLGGLLGSVLGGELEGPIGETLEMELATELLEVTNEAELEQFIGNLFKKVASGVGKFMKSGTGRALGGILKNVAKKALPVVGGALGSFVAPGVGTAIGSKLGSMAGGLFELELEGLNEQEAEFEVARRYVRLAAGAARNAALAPPSAPPQAVARAAVITSARRHAPGLLRGTPYQHRRGGRPPVRRRRPVPYGGYAYGAPSYGPGPYDPYGAAGDGGYDDTWEGTGAEAFTPVPGSRPHSGRWVRRGRKIVILGA